MKCLLCVAQCIKGSKDLDCQTNEQPLIEVLKKHFPFIEVSVEFFEKTNFDFIFKKILDRKVCLKCFNIVKKFDTLITIAKTNQEMCRAIKDEPKSDTEDESLQESVFVSTLPQIQEAELMIDQDRVKVEPCAEEYADDSFDELFIDPVQETENSERTELEKSQNRNAAVEMNSDVDENRLMRKSFKSETHQELDRMVEDLCEVRCEICETDFEAFACLSMHYKERHPDVPAVISCCGQKFSSRNGAVDHIRSQHIIKFTKCSHCEQLFRTMKSLQEHLCSEHSSFRCWNCQKGFIKQQSLTRHVKLCELTGNKFECFVCKKDTFRSYQKLRVHMTHHRNLELEKKAGKMFVCDVCSFSSRSRTSFRTHRQVHDQQRAFEEYGTGFPCEHCNKVFRSKPCVKQHMRLMHKGDLRKPCKICGKKVKFMDSHLMTHKDEPKNCPTCGILCKNKGVLKSHIRVKHVLVPHLPCQFCERLFKKRNQLMEHEATHTVSRSIELEESSLINFFQKVPLYFCDKCAKSFNQRAVSWQQSDFFFLSSFTSFRITQRTSKKFTASRAQLVYQRRGKLPRRNCYHTVLVFLNKNIFLRKTTKNYVAEWRLRNPELQKQRSKVYNKNYRLKRKSEMTEEEKMRKRQKDRDKKRRSRAKKKAQELMVVKLEPLD